jgi:hypothetical protein
MFDRRTLAPCLSALAVVAIATQAPAETVVLQNGLDGYAGFHDTFIENVAAGAPHGLDTVIQSWCG